MNTVKKIMKNECTFITSFFIGIVLYMLQLDILAEIFLVITFACIIGQSIIKRTNGRELIQFMIIIGIPMITMFLIYFRYPRTRVLLAGVCLCVSLLLDIVINRKIIEKLSFKVFFEKDIILFALLLFVFIIISIVNLGRIPLYDSGCYYSWGGMSQLADFSDYSIAKLLLAGHLSIGYAFFALIGELLFPHKVIGVQLLNMLLAVTSFCCIFYELRKLERTKSRAWMVMALLLFNPMTLGMIWETNIDNPCTYLFFIMFCAFCENLYPLFYLFSFLFVFTKEPNVIYYLFFLIGAYFYDIKRLDLGISKGISLKWKEMILSCLPIVAWVMCYFSPTYWLRDAFANIGGDNIQTISVNIDFIKIRIVQFLVENFQWALVALLIYVVIALSKRNKTIDSQLKILIFVLFSVVAFNLVYVNHTHTRYICLVYTLSALIVSALTLSLDTLWGYIANIILAALICVQTFYTIDPVSCILFQNNETGTDSKLFTTNRILKDSKPPRLNDSTIYNMEYYRFFEQLEEILGYYSYNDDMVVVFSDISHGPDSYGATDGFLYYDTDKKRVLTYRSETSIPLVWGNSIEILENYNNVVVIRPYLWEENNDLSAYLTGFKAVQNDRFDDYIFINCTLYRR